jgi:hypothetical protein
MSFHQLHQQPHPLLLPQRGMWARRSPSPMPGSPPWGQQASGRCGQRPSRRRPRQPGRNAGTCHRAAQPAHFVSADIEDGYGDDPARVAEFIVRLGAAGVNIEDSTTGPLSTRARTLPRSPASNTTAQHLCQRARRQLLAKAGRPTSTLSSLEWNAVSTLGPMEPSFLVWSTQARSARSPQESSCRSTSWPLPARR